MIMAEKPIPSMAMTLFAPKLNLLVLKLLVIRMSMEMVSISVFQNSGKFHRISTELHQNLLKLSIMPTQVVMIILQSEVVKTAVAGMVQMISSFAKQRIYVSKILAHMKAIYWYSIQVLDLLQKNSLPLISAAPLTMVKI